MDLDLNWIRIQLGPEPKAVPPPQKKLDFEQRDVSSKGPEAARHIPKLNVLIRRSPSRTAVTWSLRQVLYTQQSRTNMCLRSFLVPTLRVPVPYVKTMSRNTAGTYFWYDGGLVDRSHGLQGFNRLLNLTQTRIRGRVVDPDPVGSKTFSRIRNEFEILLVSDKLIKFKKF